MFVACSCHQFQLFDDSLIEEEKHYRSHPASSTKRDLFTAYAHVAALINFFLFFNTPSLLLTLMSSLYMVYLSAADSAHAALSLLLVTVRVHVSF